VSLIIGMTNPRNPLALDWPRLRDRLHREMRVVRSDDDRLLIEVGAPGASPSLVRVQSVRLGSRPAIELALFVAAAAQLPPGALAAANENVALGEIRIADGNAILQLALPLEDLSYAEITGTMASLVAEARRMSWMLRPHAAARVLNHFAD